MNILKARTHNKNIGKSWADGSRVLAVAASVVSCSDKHY
jgi:hypothetical protein